MENLISIDGLFDFILDLEGLYPMVRRGVDALKFAGLEISLEPSSNWEKIIELDDFNKIKKVMHQLSISENIEYSNDLTDFQEIEYKNNYLRKCREMNFLTPLDPDFEDADQGRIIRFFPCHNGLGLVTLKPAMRSSRLARFKEFIHSKAENRDIEVYGKAGRVYFYQNGLFIPEKFAHYFLANFQWVVNLSCSYENLIIRSNEELAALKLNEEQSLYATKKELSEQVLLNGIRCVSADKWRVFLGGKKISKAISFPEKNENSDTVDILNRSVWKLKERKRDRSEFTSLVRRFLGECDTSVVLPNDVLWADFLNFLDRKVERSWRVDGIVIYYCASVNACKEAIYGRKDFNDRIRKNIEKLEA